MSTSHATLSAAADDRKARLAKLKNLKRKQPADEIAPPESERSASPPAPPPRAEAEGGSQERDDDNQQQQLENDVTRLHLSGRNYDAEAKGAKLGFEAPPTASMAGPTLEQQAADVEAEIKRKAAEDAKEDKGIDLFKLQPKKPNWDLKRDLDKKLEVLNVRTDGAIARLVRERVANAQTAAKKTAKLQVGNGNGEGESEEAPGVDGVALVEGLRVREREDEEEERRERDEEDGI
ncbi:cwf18 pre-mRNA splicing factor-domain-containing protein [Annulohypoxylon truncatum]|uniref:cwf18 pre-mRNA splicing factor-domain-containing protein n=1 Tax=Annulohypoxylon truncatum TaxID=327061 RepID=UPI0020077BD3|nr:cwf18 pre-mRNA splicing factor-domain-containing protein [Annulohypoxylon truncatum]KAI1207242.1 cwf18 pre-mRNA splicing factor-domain-containing protein [Annulohypoxylon truncatum]